jgi:hypothetical protein
MVESAKGLVLSIANKPHFGLTARKACVPEDSLWPQKLAIGDKVDQAFSNQAEGTVVARFTDLAGERRY